MLSIRTASIADKAAIQHVMDRAFDPAYGEAWTADQTATLFVLPGVTVRVAGAGGADGNVLGFAATRIVADESELLLIAVDPDARGQGIGRRLFSDWLERVGAAGAGHAFLEMRADNPAVHLYARFGAREVGRRSNYYRGGDGVLRDAVTLRVPLPSTGG